MPELLTGTVTFLFTDVEGSTEVLHRGPDTYAQALDAYRRVLREAAAVAGGAEVDCRGEEFFFAFPRASDAVAAATAAQLSLTEHSWPEEGRLAVRMGIHTGEPMIHDQGYLGLDVHRAARICSLAHGGQVLVSRTTRDLLAGRRPPDVALRELGSHPLKGFSEAEELFQLVLVGLPSDFPPPRTSDAATAEPASSGRERELAAAVLRALAPHRPLAQLLGALAARRTASRGLADLGWEVRARLPHCPEPLRGELAELGGELFSGSRSLVTVDRYLAGIDRKRIARRLAEHAELGVLSKRAAAEADATARRMALLDGLTAERRRADARIGSIGVAVERICAHVDAGSAAYERSALSDVRRDVRVLTSDLDRSLEAASAAVKAAGRLRRTRRRGIYRRAERYVVPYFDEVGLEHEQEFDKLAAARAFRDARLEDEKRKIDFPGGPAPHDSAYHKSVGGGPPG
jgi:class 3 adenylate cyclase